MLVHDPLLEKEYHEDLQEPKPVVKSVQRPMAGYGSVLDQKSRIPYNEETNTKKV